MQNRPIQRFLDRYHNSQNWLYEQPEIEFFLDEDLDAPSWQVGQGELDVPTIPLPDYEENTFVNPQVVTEDEIFEDDSAEIIEIWERDTNQRGLEYYAWYRPFHYGIRDWGIYIRESGLQNLAKLLIAASIQQSGKEKLDSLIAYKLGKEILIRHEWYHHQVELFATYLEDAFEESIFTKYNQEVYSENFASKKCLEESLANAYAARSAACRRIIQNFDTIDYSELFKFKAANQPSAYRQYTDYISNDSFTNGCQVLGKQLLKGEYTTERLQLGRKLPLSTDISQIEVGKPPVYIVRDAKNQYLQQFIELGPDGSPKSWKIVEQYKQLLEKLVESGNLNINRHTHVGSVRGEHVVTDLTNALRRLEVDIERPNNMEFELNQSQRDKLRKKLREYQ